MAEKLGILGRKLGMTRIFGHDGAAIPVTVIEAGPCPVTQIKSEAKDGYNAIQIGFNKAKAKHITKPQQGHFAKADSGLFRRAREIRLNDAPTQKLGEEITVEIFAPGEIVKITGRSIGKGYQGRMRRWNFAGAKGSHGTEKVHRNNGSIGNNTFPGHVFKGRKMAGHWGDETVTQLGLKIVGVRPEENVILVKGSVPGPKNGLVLVRKQ